MFRQQERINQRIARILHWYGRFAESNPALLRFQFPTDELWRLFIEGSRHAESFDLSQYLRMNVLQHSLGKHMLSYAIKDAKHSRAVTNDFPKLIEHLNIDADSASQLTIQDLITLNTGWYYFELSEPGYLRALYRSFDSLFQFDDDLTLDYIFKLHASATRTVEYTNYDERMVIDDSKTGHVRDVTSICFPIVEDNSSLQGIYETLVRQEAHAMFNIYGFYVTADTPQTLREQGPSYISRWPSHYRPWITRIQQAQNNMELATVLFDYSRNRSEQMKLLYFVSKQPEGHYDYLTLTANEYINRYHQRIAQAYTPYQTLSSIVELVQSLEQLHVFCDANCRTLCMLLLNHLLLKNGFPLCISENPNQFDACSKQELIAMVISGMENTRILLEKGMLYGVSTSDILERQSQTTIPVIDPLYFKHTTDIESRAKRRVSMSDQSKKRKLEEDYRFNH